MVLYDVSPGWKSITVPTSVFRKWGIGAKIALTSSSRLYYEDQVRSIVNVTRLSSDDAHVQLGLDKPLLYKPTTFLESKDFAAEVALLSRNILFKGEPSSQSLFADEGGSPRGTAHFKVLRTPQLRQRIEGVEFRHFGQQGTLGRYPIHFHMCRDVRGSIVAKNTIHMSEQRCVVVHGTDNLRIWENVAYNTAGHCYMTEDVSWKSHGESQ